MSKIEKVCVYCGSGSGADPAFAAAARVLGKALADRGIGLVFGGGSIGLMGEVAAATIDHGGTVTGIIPEFLTRREHAVEVGEMIVTADMHERKRRMFEMADAFVALPGGVGTLEEIIEQMTWAQLGRHKKPILLANINGFWNPLCALLDHMEKLAFIRAGLSVTYLVEDRAENIVPRLIAAAAAVPESQAGMKTAPVEGM
jgi:uncharacterized protein (TIGR00730 family)